MGMLGVRMQQYPGSIRSHDVPGTGMAPILPYWCFLGICQMHDIIISIKEGNCNVTTKNSISEMSNAKSTIQNLLETSLFFSSYSFDSFLSFTSMQ